VQALPGLIKAVAAEANFQTITVAYAGGGKGSKGKKGKDEVSSDDDSEG